MEYFQRMAKIEEDFYERWKQMSLDRTEDAPADSLAVWDYPLGGFTDERLGLLLGQNLTMLEVFKISDLKKSLICPIICQSGPLRG